MKNVLARGVPFTVGLLVVLEVFFRTVLPASQWPLGIVGESGIRRFDTDGPTTGRMTYGRYCKGRFAWSVNGQGWNSVYDYAEASAGDRPVVAIMGDSYLEGFFSDVDKHVGVYLTDIFAGTISFCTFGMSGGFLSQYVALMKYEIGQYSPDAYVVFVNSSDVRKSFRERGGRHPYYYQYARDPAGAYAEVRRESADRSRLKRALMHSAVARYLRANAQAPIMGGGLADENANLEKPGRARAADEVTDQLREEAAFLLGVLDSFGKPVLVVADCPKNWIYEGGGEEAYPDVIALREAVGDFPNVSLLELAGPYRSDFEKEGRRFSLPDNPHWDSYATRFVAETLVPAIAQMFRND